MTGRPSKTATPARRSRATVLLTAATIAAIDLAAKAASEARLADSSVDLGLIQLQLAYNSGVAFSMGDRLPVGMIVAITAAIAGLDDTTRAALMLRGLVAIPARAYLAVPTPPPPQG